MVKKTLNYVLVTWSMLIGLALFLSYFSPFVHPSTVWWFAFLGLAYPLTLLLFLITLLLLFITKNKLRFPFLILFLLGFPIHLRLVTFNFGGGSDDANNFKVMSYNVRIFDLYNWLPEDNTVVKNQILAKIEASKPQILCFQEFLLDESANPHIKLEAIKNVIDYKDQHLKVVQEQVNKHFGLATFSSYPIIHKGSVFNENEQSQFCIYSDIKINEDTIRVYNMHLQSIRFQKEDYKVFQAADFSEVSYFQKVLNMLRKVKRAYPPRVLQTEKIIAHIKESPYPVIACGDFNDTPVSYVYNLFNRELNDSFRSAGFGIGRTYAGRIPAGRIDYIFVDPELKTYNFKVHKEVLSDHFAVEVMVGR